MSRVGVWLFQLTR